MRCSMIQSPQDFKTVVILPDESSSKFYQIRRLIPSGESQVYIDVFLQSHTARCISYSAVCWSSTMQGQHMLSLQSAGRACCTLSGKHANDNFQAFQEFRNPRRSATSDGLSHRKSLTTTVHKCIPTLTHCQIYISDRVVCGFSTVQEEHICCFRKGQEEHAVRLAARMLLIMTRKRFKTPRMILLLLNKMFYHIRTVRCSQVYSYSHIYIMSHCMLVQHDALKAYTTSAKCWNSMPYAWWQARVR